MGVQIEYLAPLTEIGLAGLRLDLQTTPLAWSLALLSDGINIAINKAMMAITTRSSMRVKALVFFIVPMRPPQARVLMIQNNSSITEWMQFVQKIALSEVYFNEI